MSGNSVKLLKLLLKFNTSRFDSFPIEDGRPWSLLKWASRYFKDSSSLMVVGRKRISLRLIDRILRLISPKPKFVGKNIRLLKLAYNSSNDLLMN